MTDVEEASRVYRISRSCFSTFFLIYNRIDASGMENIPLTGGCLVACNHASYLDPPAIASMVKHRVFRFMARDTLWNGRFMNWFMKEMRCIPVDRERGDFPAMRRVLKALKAGDLVALFPEGTRTEDGLLQETKPGVGFILVKAGVPIVPAYIAGTFRAYRKDAKYIYPQKLIVRFGSVIQVSDLPTIEQTKPSYEAITDFIMERISELRPV